MAYKSIMTILTEPKEVAPVLDAAVAFAEASQADLEVLCLGIDRTQTGYYFAGATALMHEETILQAQSEAQAIEAEARQFLARSAISWGIEGMVAQSASIAGLVARRARFADLVILPKPYGKDQYADAPRHRGVGDVSRQCAGGHSGRGSGPDGNTGARRDRVE